MRIRIFALSFLLCSSLFAQSPDTTLTHDERIEIISALENHILNHYVYSDKADSLSQLLRTQLEGGGYDEETAPTLFAQRLTQELQEWSNDLHFLVFYVRPLEPGSTLPPPGWAASDPFASIDMLDGNIAHLTNITRLHGSKDRLAETMAAVENVEGLIIDFKTCTGGSRASITFLMSYFFDKPTHYVTEFQRGKKPQKVKTLRKIPGKRLTGIPVYILTSKKTASGCEAVAYHLKHFERAIIVGETTAGAAHAVKTFDLAGNFRAFIPRIRFENTMTNADWEAKGVIPSIPSTTKDALDTAHKHALRSR